MKCSSLFAHSDNSIVVTLCWAAILYSVSAATTVAIIDAAAAAVPATIFARRHHCRRRRCRCRAPSRHLRPSPPLPPPPPPFRPPPPPAATTAAAGRPSASTRHTHTLDINGTTCLLCALAERQRPLTSFNSVRREWRALLVSRLLSATRARSLSVARASVYGKSDETLIECDARACKLHLANLSC